MNLKRVRKSIAGLLALAMLALPVPLPVADAQVSTSPQYFWFQVVDERGEPYTGQNVKCSVFRPNQTGAIQLHGAASLANFPSGRDPLVSDASGKLHFYSTSQDPVDVTCYYIFGGSAYINKLDRFTHKVVVPRQQFDKISRFSVTAGPGSATNQSSGITLPAGAVVRDVIVQNLAPLGVASAFHISVGFGGNHAVAANVNALVNAQALTSPDEWLRPHMIGSSADPQALANGNHRGAALSVFHAGACGGGAGAACGGNNGTGINVYRETPYLIHVASGLDVTYAIAVPGTGNARLHVYILWEQFHTGINRQGLTN